MSKWPASKAKQVLAALERIGWQVQRQRGSHRLLTRPGWPDYEFAFHDRDEIGPRMLAHAAPSLRSARGHTLTTPVTDVQDGNRIAPDGEQNPVYMRLAAI
jgi:predicted RNA binding protein YcfA (HicA-like mRNA interferase family)